VTIELADGASKSVALMSARPTTTEVKPEMLDDAEHSE
jgi:hypothetical protein